MADPRAKFLISAGTDFRRADRETKTFFGSVGRAARAGGAVAAAAVTAGAIGIATLEERAAMAAETLADTSDKLGIATERLAALQLAGRLTGVQNEKLTMGMQRMARRIAEAAKGTGEAKDALKELGIDAAALSQLTLDEQFERIAISMSGVDSQSDKIRLGFKLFDSEGVDLIRTLDVMGTDFARIEEEARAFGVAISRVDAEKIAQAGDAVERAETALLGIGTRIALAVAPIKENLANAFSGAALASEGFKDEINATMRALVVGVNFAANSLRGIALAFKFTQLAMLEIQRFKESLEAGARQELQRQLAVARKQRDRFPEGDPRRFELGNSVAVLESRLASMEATTLDGIIARQDEVGRQIDAIVGKFRTAEEALSHFEELQRKAQERAAATVAEQTGTPLQPFSLEQLEERQNMQRELLVEHAKETHEELLKLERKAAKERERINAKAEQAIQAQKTQTANLAVGLLQALGSKNKAFAIAAIVLEKALAIQRVLLANRVAAELAFASQLIPGDPTSIARAAAAKAAVLTQGRISAALIAATGIVQIASLGEGSTGAPLGTPTNPIFTAGEDGTGQEPQETRRIVEITIIGNGILLQDELKTVLRDAVDADEVFIHTGTRQAQVIRGPG